MQTDLLSYVESLTVPEVDRKAQLEATIERGMQTFVEVGLALMEIRDGRLYRAEFGTFEEYCQERWGWTDRRARMLISAAGVMDNLKTGTTVPVLPANEAQVRPLATLPPDLQRAAWREAVDTAPNGKVTGPHVQDVSPWPVWLLFLHFDGQAKDSPAGCPTGLFGNSLRYLSQHEHHRHKNGGRGGMVYWQDTTLRKIAELSDVLPR